MTAEPSGRLRSLNHSRCSSNIPRSGLQRNHPSQSPSHCPSMPPLIRQPAIVFLPICYPKPMFVCRFAECLGSARITRNYDNISRHSAMSIGGSTDPEQIRLSHLQTLATDLRINAKAVIGTATRLCDQISDALTETAQKFESQFGPSPVLERIPLIIRKQIRRLRQALTRSH